LQRKKERGESQNSVQFTMKSVSMVVVVNHCRGRRGGGLKKERK
jgi:hypothetical protein